MPHGNPLLVTGRHIIGRPSNRALAALMLTGALAVALAGCLPQPVVPPSPQPDVTPIVDPQPVPKTGSRVLIVYESDANNSRETLNTLNSTSLLELLNDRCESWRKWDKTSIDSTGLGDEEPEWRVIWSKVSTSLGELPKLVLIRDGKATVKALPATEAETLDVIRKAVQ